MGKNVELSERVSKAIGLDPERPHQNAGVALHHIDMKGALYVQGYIPTVAGDDIRKHGWLELDGQIIDPTFPVEPLAYFPEDHWTWDEVWKLAGKPKPGEKPEGLPLEYRPGSTAYQDALRHVGKNPLATPEE